MLSYIKSNSISAHISDRETTLQMVKLKVKLSKLKKYMKGQGRRKAGKKKKKTERGKKDQHK